jgi:hypothetical protein
MSDEFFDLNSIQIRGRRGRKSKYTHRLWEAQTDKEKARYALIMSDNWERRKDNGKVGTGRIVWNKTNGHVSYIDDENPYEKFVDKKTEYELRMEMVFHSDVEVIADTESSDGFIEFDAPAQTDSKVFINPSLNKIVNIKMKDFVVLSGFFYDDKMNDVVAKVPKGVVSEKMSLVQIQEKVEAFASSKAFSKIASHHKKVILMWLTAANRQIKGIADSGTNPITSDGEYFELGD